MLTITVTLYGLQQRPGALVHNAKANPRRAHGMQNYIWGLCECAAAPD